MNSFRVCALIVLCTNDYYSCCRPNIPEPKSNNSGLSIFFSSDKDIETKKRNDRINKLVECEMFMKGINKDDFLSVAKLRTDVEGKINEFDKKITKKTCEIDKNNLYVIPNSTEYHKKLQQNTKVFNVCETEAANIHPDTSAFISSLQQCLTNLVIDKSHVQFVAHEDEDVSMDDGSSVYLLKQPIKTFEELKDNFLDCINHLTFSWYPEEWVADSGGPSRQLLGDFYRNLLETETTKLNQKKAINAYYLVFGSDMDYDDAMLLGQLAFLSLTKESSMEYNLPEVYYKIMLHDKDENLEDYLTLADFKTMIGIMKETKDGNTVDGKLLIPVDIKINPNKDRVFLKYAKEEVYKIYLRLCQEDDVKDFKDTDKTMKDSDPEGFVDNFEEEIAKLMFGELGIKIKKVLNGFMDGFTGLFEAIDSLSSYKNFRFLEEYITSYDPFIWFFKESARLETLRNITNGIINDSEEVFVVNRVDGKVLIVTFNESVINDLEDEMKRLEKINIIPIYLPEPGTGDLLNDEERNNLIQLINNLEEVNFTQANLNKGSVLQAIAKVKQAKSTDEQALPEFRHFLKNKRFRAKDLKLFFEGEEMRSFADIISRIDIVYPEGYDKSQLTKNDVQNIIGRQIYNVMNQYTDQASRNKCVKECLIALLRYICGSTVFRGRITITISNVALCQVNTCQRIIIAPYTNTKQRLALLMAFIMNNRHNENFFTFQEE